MAGLGSAAWASVPAVPAAAVPSCRPKSLSSPLPPGRLASLRNRDLTLGGALKKPKTFEPNVHALRKNKEELKEELHIAPKKGRKQRNEKRRESGGRKKERRQTIQSHSIFEQGPAETKRRTVCRGATDLIYTHPVCRSVKKESEEDQDEILHKLRRDDFIDDPALRNDDRLKPIQLPLRQCSRFTQSHSSTALRRARAPSSIMHTFYSGTIESIMSSCITVWYGACTVSCRKSLQRIVRIAEKIIGVSLPPLLDIYNSRLTRKATRIAGDPTHPSYSLFSLLPSGRRLQSLRARTSRLKNSLFHQAVRRLNSLPALPPIRPLIPFPFPAPASIPPPPPSTLCPQLSTLLHPSAPSALHPPPLHPATVCHYRTWHHPPPPPPPACSTNSRTLNSAQPSLYCYAICTLPHFLTSSALCLYY
ncbi:uncharacterized protein LOC114481395 isoform X2 [Gouania willdenowi]|uniref:uncharacterized protein LOC114481395 isoform X2 n=1 Tax=Gouania willdenowi TaxID=441366 RepID=UPI00105485CF|nr:uncharacterized protein LOC114481395 isoform X2 [Gouania willdenowi]